MIVNFIHTLYLNPLKMIINQYICISKCKGIIMFAIYREIELLKNGENSKIFFLCLQ